MQAPPSSVLAVCHAHSLKSHLVSGCHLDPLLVAPQHSAVKRHLRAWIGPRALCAYISARAHGTRWYFHFIRNRHAREGTSLPQWSSCRPDFRSPSRRRSCKGPRSRCVPHGRPPVARWLQAFRDRGDTLCRTPWLWLPSCARTRDCRNGVFSGQRCFSRAVQPEERRSRGCVSLVGLWPVQSMWSGGRNLLQVISGNWDEHGWGVLSVCHCPTLSLPGEDTL